MFMAAGRPNGIELDDLDMDWSGDNGIVVRCPNSLYFKHYITWIMLLLVCSNYVAVLCDWCGHIGVTLWIMMIMALSENTWSNMMICVVNYVKYDHIYLHLK